MVRDVAPAVCAQDLWARTDLGPAGSSSTAQLYDGFSIIPFQWLEALGLLRSAARRGPSSPRATRAAAVGMPMNTDGGACNVGRRHGANFCIEGVRQLRGECGERQVEGAKTTVFSNSFGPFCGAVLLRTD